MFNCQDPSLSLILFTKLHKDQIFAQFGTERSTTHSFMYIWAEFKLCFSELKYGIYLLWVTTTYAAPVY